LYCIILLLYYAQYFILETVVLTFIYCIVLCLFVLFVRYMFFLTSFMSDCCMTEFVDLWNDMCVCMYICIWREKRNMYRVLVAKPGWTICRKWNMTQLSSLGRKAE